MSRFSPIPFLDRELHAVFAALETEIRYRDIDMHYTVRPFLPFSIAWLRKYTDAKLSDGSSVTCSYIDLAVVEDIADGGSRIALVVLVRLNELGVKKAFLEQQGVNVVARLPTESIAELITRVGEGLDSKVDFTIAGGEGKKKERLVKGLVERGIGLSRPLPSPKRPSLTAQQELALQTALSNQRAEYRLWHEVSLSEFIRPNTHVKPDRHTPERIRRRGNVDFLVTTMVPEGVPLFAIEVDGKAHDNLKSLRRDKAKDRLFEEAGLTLLRIKADNLILGKRLVRIVELCVWPLVTYVMRFNRYYTSKEFTRSSALRVKAFIAMQASGVRPSAGFKEYLSREEVNELEQIETILLDDRVDFAIAEDHYGPGTMLRQFADNCAVSVSEFSIHSDEEGTSVCFKASRNDGASEMHRLYPPLKITGVVPANIAEYLERSVALDLLISYAEDRWNRSSPRA